MDHEPHVFKPNANERYARACQTCGRVEDYGWHIDVSLTSFETYSGLYFDYADPQPNQIDLGDIARSLSLTVRFRGHVSRFYSVAEHARRVAELVLGESEDPRLALGGLHHDDHETYLGDWPTPLKRALPSPLVKEMEHRCDAAIGLRLGIDPALFHHELVKEADNEMKLREAATLKVSRGVSAQWQNSKPYAPIPDAGRASPVAEADFLHYHDWLVKQCQT